MNKKELLALVLVIGAALYWKKRSVPITAGATQILPEGQNTGIVPPDFKRLIADPIQVALPFNPGNSMGFPAAGE